MSKLKEHFEEMRTKSKANLMKTALKLFSEKGYHSTSISAISKEAGVATGLMYNYFNSKDELLVSIINEFFEDLSNSILKEFNENSEKQDIRKIIDATIEAIKEKKESWRLLISISLQPDVSKVCMNQIGNFSMHQQGIFEQHFTMKGVERPKESAEILGAILHGAYFQYAFSGDLNGILILRNTIVESLIENGY